MRILQVRFKNLNSLAGEWLIDFTHPAFVSTGIFAIIGPTGAGKTTVLDAICLALYGRTPRLDKVNKNVNEIMSRQTGECFAEVSFETQVGHYRCHWSQHRARKKPEGELQVPKHEIVDADSGRVLETKIIKVAGLVEKVTGMDFGRFTRSMLLAQGGFAAFLQAGPDERAPILEQITGTEIYSQISIKVHERHRAEREKLNFLQAEMSGISVLTAEQEKEISHKLVEKQTQENEVTIQVLKTGRAIAWFDSMDELRAEIKTLSEASEKLNTELEAFKPEREQLNRAQKAAVIEAFYVSLMSARKQQDEDRKALENEQSRLPEITSRVQQHEEALKKATEATASAREARRAGAQVIQRVRALDQRLKDRRETIEAEEILCKTINEQIISDKHLLQQKEKKLENAKIDLRRVLRYSHHNARDEKLVRELAGIEEQLNNLISVQAAIKEKTALQEKVLEQLALAAKNHNNYAGIVVDCKQQMLGIEKQIENKKKDLERLLNKRLLREYRAEKDALLREQVLLRKISNLDSERTKLVEGEPCPLCGSREHPYATGHVPQMNETEKKIETLNALIKQAEQLESTIKTLETAGNDAFKAVTATEKLEADAASEKKNTSAKLGDLANEIKKSNQHYADLKRSALVRLQPLGIQAIPESEIASLLEPLKKRFKNWQDCQEKKSQIEKCISELASELKRITAVIEIQNKALLEKQTALGVHEKSLDVHYVERQNLLGSKDPDAEERRLDKAVCDAELIEKNAYLSWDEARQLLHTIKVQITSLKARVEKRMPENQKLEIDFADELHAAGFANEQQFSASRLALQDREKLEAKAKSFDNRYVELQARRRDRENRLTMEVDKKVTESKREEVEFENQALEQTLKQLCDQIAGFKHKLAENKAALTKMSEKQALIEAQKKICSRWEQLHLLIGSADGKKYRNFAQGLTFEMMINHANRQLQKLTDRYLLIRDDEQPLELNVIDNYQAGEIRSTKNLSGGEGFIVSLSLALGLSHMASRNVRIDSLFLDEGFGTLDEEALDMALETLSSLQQDGKLIGVISHVSALKERIGTQIQVTPRTGGTSQISGPGCERIGEEVAQGQYVS